MRTATSEDSDPVLVALESLVVDLEKNLEANAAAIDCARRIKELRLQGLPYREIVDEAGSPMVVSLITENLGRLRTSGTALRQAQAKALHDEGLTMEQIGRLYGVTRQRISALLRAEASR